MLQSLFTAWPFRWSATARLPGNQNGVPETRPPFLYHSAHLALEQQSEPGGRDTKETRNADFFL